MKKDWFREIRCGLSKIAFWVEIGLTNNTLRPIDKEKIKQFSNKIKILGSLCPVSVMPGMLTETVRVSNQS